MEPTVFTVKETAEFLRISPSKTYQLIQVGVIPCIAIGRRRLVPRKQLLALLEDTLERGGTL